MRNSQEVEDFNLFTSPLSHPAFQQGDSMKLDLEELDELHETCTADSWRTLGGLLVESYPDIKRLIEASRKLHQYLIDTDEEGLIQHAVQMEELGAALVFFDKEQQ